MSYRYIVKPFYPKAIPEKLFLVFDRDVPVYNHIRDLEPNWILKAQSTRAVGRWFGGKGIASREWRLSIPTTVNDDDAFFDLLMVAELIV